MAKNFLVAFTILLAAASVSCSKGLRVVLYNNTPVDLVVHAEPDKILANIGPGESAEFYFQESQWIDFGMIAHRYENKGFRWTGFVHEDTVKVQAENDGRLYLVPFDASFPVKTFPEQPAGFPLVPVKKVDLT